MRPGNVLLEAHRQPLHDRWSDPRLRFEPACNDKLMLARNEALQIWRPDIYFDQASLAPAGYAPAPS